MSVVDNPAYTLLSTSEEGPEAEDWQDVERQLISIAEKTFR